MQQILLWSKRIPSIGLCSSNSAREVILLLEVKHIPIDLFRSQTTWQVADGRHDWQFFSSQSLTQAVLPYFGMTIPSQEETWLCLLPWFVVSLAQKKAYTSSSYFNIVATYPSAGGRRETHGCIFQGRKMRGVTTNIYSRKTSEKPERAWSMNFKWKVRELFLRTGKVLAPHASVTRDDSL